jgi:hypothetical protein
MDIHSALPDVRPVMTCYSGGLSAVYITCMHNLSVVFLVCMRSIEWGFRASALPADGCVWPVPCRGK